MKQRCLNQRHKSYQRYGGRGITVCGRWHVFDNFLEDMGERPEGLTLERKDNSKGYSPDNCVWKSPADQARNRTNTKILEHGGVRLCLRDWAERVGISEGCLQRRLSYYRWSLDKALTTPTQKGSRPRNEKANK